MVKKIINALVRFFKELFDLDFMVVHNELIDRYTVYDLDGNIISYKEPRVHEDYRVKMQDLTVEQLEKFFKFYKKFVFYRGTRVAEYVPTASKNDWIILVKAGDDSLYFANENELMKLFSRYNIDDKVM